MTEAPARAGARAAVFDGPGRPLRFAVFPLSDPGPGEALVAVRLATICGSDVSSFLGRRIEPAPSVLGHETVGEVLAAGEGTRAVDGMPLRPGDRVVWSIAASCGACHSCTHDLPQKCDRLFKYGHRRVEDPPPLSGGLASHVHLVAGTSIVRVPASVPDEAAAPAECATATAMGALEAGGDPAGAAVLVLGAGLLGISIAAAARSRGAGSVVVCDRDPRRRHLALTFGADAALGPEELPRLTPGDGGRRGADVVFEVTGAQEMAAASLEAARVGGTVVWLGATHPTPPVAVVPERMIRRHLTLRGVHNYRPRHLVQAMEFLAAAQYPFAGLVGRRFPLSSVADAFAVAAAAEHLRVAVVPD